MAGQGHNKEGIPLQKVLYDPEKKLVVSIKFFEISISYMNVCLCHNHIMSFNKLKHHFEKSTISYNFSNENSNYHFCRYYPFNLIKITLK